MRLCCVGNNLFDDIDRYFLGDCLSFIDNRQLSFIVKSGEHYSFKTPLFPERDKVMTKRTDINYERSSTPGAISSQAEYSELQTDGSENVS